MEPLIRQLEHVRRRTRILLVLMRGSTWLAVVLAAAVIAGFADFVLRLPGWVRLGLLMAGLLVAGFYLVRWLNRVARVRPGLPSLALRLERLYPAAAGRLASAVAFATQGTGGESPITFQLARRTTDAAEGVLDEDQVDRLIDTRPVFRAVIGLAVVVGLFSGIALGSPDSFHTAVRRWTDPLGPAQWPNRYQVRSLVKRGVAPNNTPLAMSAQVVKGDREKLRTWAVYRFVRDNAPPGEWQRQLMTRQDDEGVYERMLEPNPAASEVEFYFEAGDDATDPQTVKLIQPPSLSALIAEVSPPVYAGNILPIDRQDLLQPPRPTVTMDGLEGSRVRLRLSVLGSVKTPPPDANTDQLRDWLAHTLDGLLANTTAESWGAIDPAFAPVEPAGGATQFEVAFNLVAPVRFRFRFSDAYGSSPYDDPRLFAFEVRPDRLPRAAVTEPSADASVLPTALLPVAAEGNDDVAVRQLELVSRRQGQQPAVLGTDKPAKPRARVESKLDLQPLGLKAGDELALVAVARDNFRLGDREHDPVESAPRVLRIIGPDELSRQLHGELSEVRQRALRAGATQKQLIETEPNAATAREQQDLTERLAGIDRSVKQLQERVALNRFDDEATKQVLEKADQLLNEANRASLQGAQHLSAAAMDPQKAADQTEQARADQRQASAKIDELTQLLDQGRDAYELRQNLIKTAREQQNIGERVKQILPKTLGRDLSQLTDQQKKELAEIAQKQGELAQQSKELAERMRSTAAAIQRQSENPNEQATAEALRQASETATKQQLDQKMQKASQQTGQNRLADARQSQQQAQQTLQEMLQQMDRADQLKQDILRRKLTELVEAIRRLRDQQQGQLERLNAAQNLEDLDAPMLTLRRNTLSVSETARRTHEKAGPIGDALDRAAGHESRAVEELRAAQIKKDLVEASERASLASLEEALKLAEKLAQSAQQKLTEEERGKLVEAYTRILEAQKAVRDETGTLTGTAEADRNRKWKADSLRLGKSQEEVGRSLGELKTKVEKTVVYKAAHEEMDRWIADAAKNLAEAQPTRGTLFEQEMTLSSIQSLIDALKAEQPDEQFAEGEPSGGGEGGSGGPQPLIPPIAELKLLRGRQQVIHDTTRAMEAIDDPKVRPTILQDLANQQKALAATAQQLLQQLQQQQQQGPPKPVEKD